MHSNDTKVMNYKSLEIVFITFVSFECIQTTLAGGLGGL